MRAPADIAGLVRRKFQSYRSAWLLAADGFPLSLPLHPPVERTVEGDLTTVKRWLASWREQPLHGATLEWEERSWRTFGTQQLPVSITLPDPATVARWANAYPAWERARARFAKLAVRWPEARVALANHFDDLASYPDDELARSIAFVEWIRAHPDSGLYLRQLPIAGLHTKWTEPRTKWLGDLLRALVPHASAADSFSDLCGLRTAPERGRLRILCPHLRAQVGGLSDIESPWEDIDRLPLAPSTILIAENKTNGLALGERDDTVVFMGRGYDVLALSMVPWLQRDGARVLYWGDIDTHGFAILNRLRSHLPQVESVLMDETTLFAHRELWTHEDEPARPEALEHLTAAEHKLYDDLKADRWQQPGVRLEQERIAWPEAVRAIDKATGVD